MINIALKGLKTLKTKLDELYNILVANQATSPVNWPQSLKNLQKKLKTIIAICLLN